MQRADTLDLMFLDAGPISFEASMDATSPRAEQADDGLLALPHAADQDLPGALRAEGSLSLLGSARQERGREEEEEEEREKGQKERDRGKGGGRDF